MMLFVRASALGVFPLFCSSDLAIDLCFHLKKESFDNHCRLFFSAAFQNNTPKELDTFACICFPQSFGSAQ
jgi:hypothetical protein